jgi:phospholipid/cholesterol/gamma-HCH transport system permease protein
MPDIITTAEVEERSTAWLPGALLGVIGKRFSESVRVVGGVTSLTIRCWKVLFARGTDLEETVRQLYIVGNRSFSIVGLIALFSGLVMALQLSVGLGRFGLKLYVGQVVGLSVFRELAPVLTAIMVAARVGSGIAAELGSMVVTEQVLAIEAMGADPVKKLVLPRVIATMIAMPLLTIMADIIGTLGGMVISVREAGVTPRFYIDQVRNTLIMDDFTSGLLKALFFGYYVGIIACYQGLEARGGTEGVGRVTTKAVVIASITIFVSDFFLTKLTLYF